MNRFTVDADRDAIALIRASLYRDEEAMLAILHNCDLVRVINSMAEMYSHGTRRECNDPDWQLDRYLANVESFVAAQESADAREREMRAWVASNPLPTPDEEGNCP